MLGQPLVDERVVGRQQIQKTAIFAEDAGDEELGLLHERLAQELVEWEDERIRFDRFDVSQVEPLPGEIGDQRIGTRIGQHAAYLLLQHRLVLQLAALREIEQLIVGNTAPEKE